MNSIPANALRRLGGARRLLTSCNDRLLASGLQPATAETDPRLLLQRGLAYGIVASELIHTTMHIGTAAHAMPILRAFLELSVRMFWASHGRWDRYFAWAATNQLTTLQKWPNRQQDERRAEYEQSERELIAAKAKAKGMPDLMTLLAEIDADDRADPVFAHTMPWEESSEEWSKLTCYHVLTRWLHPAAHGSPESLSSDMERDDWSLDGLVLLFVTVWLCRAVHIQSRWKQEPVLWAYQWITRGVKDPSDPFDEQQGSYCDLGLTELPAE